MDLYLKVKVHQYTDGSMELFVPAYDDDNSLICEHVVPLTKQQSKDIRTLRYLSWMDDTDKVW